MSLLTIIQDACDRVGLARATSVVGSSDHQVRRLLSLSTQDGKSLARRHDWQALTIEKTFTATATTTQTGPLPAAFDRIVPRSFWNRTANRPVTGPLSPQRWQQLQAGVAASPWDTFRIQGTALLMYPTPTAGDSMAFEYVSKYWCSSAGGTAPTQAAWVADTDIAFFDEELMTMGVVWRFKKSSGLDYGEDFTDYETRLASLTGHDGGQTDLIMGGGDPYTVGDPTITDGSWSL